MLSFENPISVLSSSVKLSAELVFAIINEIATQIRRIIPPADVELKNDLKALRLISFAICAKIQKPYILSGNNL